MSKPQVHHHTKVKRKRPVLKTVFLTPVVCLWLIVIAVFPKLKKVWDPSPIQVRIIGQETKEFVDFHGKAYAVREPKEEDINPDNPCSAIPVRESIAFVVDRPELLTNLSAHTLRSIERYFKINGYTITTMIVTVDGKSTAHVLN